MALSQPIFQENDTADQHAIDLRRWARDMYGSRGGVMAPGHCLVSQRGAGANMSVDVAIGGMMIPGSVVTQHGFYYVFNDAVVNVPGIVSDGANPRIVSIIARVRDSFYSGSDNDVILEPVMGTPAGSPVPPDLVAAGKTNYLELARVTLTAGDTAVVNGEISNIARTTVPIGAVIPCTLATLPSAPYEGTTVYLTDLNIYQFYNGASWQPISGAGCKVNRTTDQTITTGAITALSWQAAASDPFSMWGGGSTVTVPWKGYYGCSVCAIWASSNSGFYRRLTLLVSGGAEDMQSLQLANTADVNPLRQNVSAVGMLLNAGQTLSASVQHDAGADRTIQASVSNMKVAYLGPAA